MVGTRLLALNKAVPVAMGLIFSWEPDMEHLITGMMRVRCTIEEKPWALSLSGGLSTLRSQEDFLHEVDSHLSSENG